MNAVYMYNKHAKQYGFKTTFLLKFNPVMFISFRTDMSGQTVRTQRAANFQVSEILGFCYT